MYAGVWPTQGQEHTSSDFVRVSPRGGKQRWQGLLCMHCHGFGSVVTSLEIACKVTWPPHMGATNLSGLKYMPLICPTEKYNGKISSVISVDLLTLSGSSFFWHPRPSHHNSPIGHGCPLPVLAWSWPVTSGQWQVVFILSMIWPRPMVHCLPYLQIGGRQYCLKWPSFLCDYLYFTLTLSASSTSSLTSQWPPMALEIALGLRPRAISRASGCKIPALGKSLGPQGIYFPIHPSSRQCTDTINHHHLHPRH